MDRKIMESLGAMLLIDGIAFMALLLVAVFNASSPWVAVSAMEFIALHPDLLALVILSGPFVVLILGVCRKVEEAFMSIITLVLGFQREDRGNHKPRDGEG